MKKFKKLISFLLFIISCFVLCFNSFAIQNSTLSGKVTETSLKSASGAICYVLVNKGDSANIVRKVGKDDSIRVYYENRSKKTSKIQLIQVDTEKNNRETVLKSQTIGKGKNGYFDKKVTKFNLFDRYTYKIKLIDGDNVGVAVSIIGWDEKTWLGQKAYRKGGFN